MFFKNAIWHSTLQIEIKKSYIKLCIYSINFTLIFSYVKINSNGQITSVSVEEQGS